MNDNIAEVLASLPEELRRAAKRLWSHSHEITAEATDTLAASYRLLRQVCGNPDVLSAAGSQLADEVASHIAQAREHIDQTYPAASQSWQGPGAESFREYLPRLSGALHSVQASAVHTAEAVDVFSAGVADIYATIVQRTERADEEVVATVSATRRCASG